MVVKNFNAHIMTKILAILPGTSCIINWAVIQLFMLEFPFTLPTPKCYCLEIIQWCLQRVSWTSVKAVYIMWSGNVICYIWRACSKNWGFSL